MRNRGPRKPRRSNRTSSLIQLEALEARTLFAGDTIAPSALLQRVPTVNAWSTSRLITVNYAEDQAIDVSSITSNDLRVVAPDGTICRVLFVDSVPMGKGRSARYRVFAPGGLFDDGSNGAYTVKLVAGQVRDRAGNVAPASTLGTFNVAVPAYPTTILSDPSRAGLNSNGVDVRAFGAIPNDGIDDTSAIQAAIDSLPPGIGVPGGKTTTGGVVNFPAGTFNLSSPLRLTSCVWLRGQGDGSTGTILANTSTDAGSTAILFYTPWWHGYCISPGIQNLSITTIAARGIGIDPTVRIALDDPTIDHVSISAGGDGIRLDGASTIGAQIVDVTIYNPGAAALWLDTGQGSVINHLENVRVQGQARAGFRATRLVVLMGEQTIDNLVIQDVGARVIPLALSGAITARNICVLTGRKNLRDASLIRIENAQRVWLDHLDWLDGAREVVLDNAWSVEVGSLSLAGGWSLAECATIDADSHLSVGTLQLLDDPAPVPSTRGYDVQGVQVISADPGAFFSATPPETFASGRGVLAPLSSLVCSVASFGAIPNDNIDDTVAIQAAIDALPRGSGLGDAATGGLVLLAEGIYDLSATLRLPSGVWLRGQGDGTVLYSHSQDAAAPVVAFVSSYSHGECVGAGVQYVCLANDAGGGIAIAPGVSAVVDALIEHVRVNSNGVDFDLRAAPAFHCTINWCAANDVGNTALYLGDASGASTGNVVNGLGLYGSARDTFNARALVVLGGGFTFSNGWIENPTTSALPLLVSGSGSISGTWIEYRPELLPENVLVSFENASDVLVDDFLLADQMHRIRLRNSNVRFAHFTTNGTDTALSPCLDLDSRSHISIGTVITRFDAGMLDDPRVQIDGVYSALFHTYSATRYMFAGQNLVSELTSSNLRNYAYNEVLDESTAPDWAITWGDSLGSVDGYSVIEQTPDGPRLKLVVTANTSGRAIVVRVRLNVPTSAVGRSGYATWRSDGPGQVIVNSRDWTHQYPTRVMGSQTGAIMPTPLAGGDFVQFVFTAAAVGTYYLSGVRVAAG
jgi:hypothetical protein